MAKEMLARPLPDFTLPLIQDARINIDLGGDPVWFEAKAGDIPMQIVKGYLNRLAKGTEQVFMRPEISRENKATFNVQWLKTDGKSVDEWLTIELKFKKKPH